MRFGSKRPFGCSRTVTSGNGTERLSREGAKASKWKRVFDPACLALGQKQPERSHYRAEACSKKRSKAKVIRMARVDLTTKYPERRPGVARRARNLLEKSAAHPCNPRWFEFVSFVCFAVQACLSTNSRCSRSGLHSNPRSCATSVQPTRRTKSLRRWAGWRGGFCELFADDGNGSIHGSGICALPLSSSL